MRSDCSTWPLHSCDVDAGVPAGGQDASCGIGECRQFCTECLRFCCRFKVEVSLLDVALDSVVQCLGRPFAQAVQADGFTAFYFDRQAVCEDSDVEPTATTSANATVFAVRFSPSVIVICVPSYLMDWVLRSRLSRWYQGSPAVRGFWFCFTWSYSLPVRVYDAAGADLLPTL